jgi:hypothetical protein
MAASSEIERKLFWREFLCLWGAGVGLETLAIRLSAMSPAGLARELVIPLHIQSAAFIELLLLAQNAIHLAIAVGVGLVAAHKAGMGAPILEGWFRRQPIGALMRASILPIVLTVVIYVACATFANSSLFRPTQKLNVEAVSRLANSPEADKAFEEMQRLGLAGTGRVSELSITVSDLANATAGEINRRLLEVSVFVLLFVQIFGYRKTPVDFRLLWIAALIVALFATVESVWIARENTLLVDRIFHGVGLPLQIGSIWWVAVRRAAQMIPTGIALGLLYGCYGIESAIIASFCGAGASHLFVVYWLIHFR